MFVSEVDSEGLAPEEGPRFDGPPTGVEPGGLHGVPDDLEQIPPGRFLAAILSAIDRSKLTGFDTVRVLKARHRQIAHEQAELAADMVEISYRTDAELGRADEAWDYASDEIRAALTLTRRAAESQLDFATDLYERYPRVWETLSQGHIDIRKARTIVHGVSHLDTDTAALVVDEILPKAAGLTTGQLNSRLQKLAVEVDPDTAKKKYEDALKERRLISAQNPQGTANLSGLDLPPHKVAAIRGRIEVQARALKAGGDPRTMDQLRADIYLDYLNGKHHHKGKKTGNRKKMDGGGVITMTASLETLAGLSEKTADVLGLGVVIADIAQQVLVDHPDAEYRFKITGADGEVHIGTPSRYATAELRRYVETRDEECVEPGCRVPAVDCDIDHLQRHVDGGPTNDINSDPLCRHGHGVKDKGGWKLTRNTDGSYTWTSTLGHTYTVRAPP